MIDGSDGARVLLEKIKSIAPTFTWSRYTHRLFFHWGFNQDPRRSKALNGQIEIATEDKQQQELIWEMIIAEQAARNRKMISVVQNMGPLTHDEANAIASIIYDTHILGDYIEGTEYSAKSLLEFSSLLGDIISATRKLGCRDAKALNEFKRKTKQVEESGLDYAEKARAVLSIMFEDIPRMIEKSSRVKRAISGK